MSAVELIPGATVADAERWAQLDELADAVDLIDLELSWATRGERWALITLRKRIVRLVEQLAEGATP